MNTMHRGVRGANSGGTPLCRSCANAHYFHGRSQTELTLVCDAFWQPRVLEFEVYDCSEYKRDHTDLDEMRKIAWTISATKGSKVGFAPPKKAEG